MNVVPGPMVTVIVLSDADSCRSAASVRNFMCHGGSQLWYLCEDTFACLTACCAVGKSSISFLACHLLSAVSDQVQNSVSDLLLMFPDDLNQNFR